MKQKQFTEDQIREIAPRRQKGEQLIEELCRAFGCSPASYSTWKKKYGDTTPDEAKRLALDDDVVAQHLECSDNTVYRVRRRFNEGGLELALHHRHPQSRKPRTLSPEAEAHLIALACTHEPGHARVSLRLLADKMVELGHVEKVSHETVRKTLKKTPSNLI